MKKVMRFAALLMGSLMGLLRGGGDRAGVYHGRMAAANGWAPSPHENGRIAREFESEMTLPYLLATAGSGSGLADLCGASDAPLGVCQDTPGVGERGTIHHLGAVKGTLTMVVTMGVAEGALVYTSGGGKVSGASASGRWKVGRAITAAASGNDLIEVVPCFPVEV